MRVFGEIRAATVLAWLLLSVSFEPISNGNKDIIHTRIYIIVITICRHMDGGRKGYLNFWGNTYSFINRFIVSQVPRLGSQRIVRIMWVKVDFWDVLWREYDRGNKYNLGNDQVQVGSWNERIFFNWTTNK